MGFFSRLAGWLGASPPTPIGDLSAFEAWMDSRGTRVIDAERAARIATVHACWKVLSESVAQLPLHLYRKSGARREIASDHPLDTFFSWRPGPRLTPFEVMEHTVVPMCASGRGVWQKIVSRKGELLDLQQLHVELLKPLPPNGMLFEYQRTPTERVTLGRDELWISDYFLGLSPLALMMRQLGQAQALDEHAENYFDNGTVLGGVLKWPGKLEPEEKERLLSKWNAQHQGSRNAFRVGLLSGGLDFTPYSVKNTEAQFLESRRFSKEEIAAVYRVPPHMVNDLTRATFSNVEHQDIAFVKHSLTPWLVRIEQSMARDLLTPAEREEFYFAFNVDGLQRGDYTTRMNGYAVGIQNGILTPNECRAWEDLPPLPGGGELRFPLNQRPGGDAMAVPDGGRGPLQPNGGAAAEEGDTDGTEQ